MADAIKNKLAAKILKAEMLGDHETISRLKFELANLKSESCSHSKKPDNSHNGRLSAMPDIPKTHSDRINTDHNKRNNNRSTCGKIKKFMDSTSSLSQMFVQEKGLTASDEAKMFIKTSAKFSRDNMDTKYFSEEIDDSQIILNKTKRHKQDATRESVDKSEVDRAKKEQATCDRCDERRARHLIVDVGSEYVYMCLIEAKPLFSSMSNVLILNKDHSCSSFVSASEDHQVAAEKAIESLRDAWKSKGYRCILMETYFKNRRMTGREFISGLNHFQIHCLPIREKYYERARMCFKQALQASGGDWSMNRKIIQTDGRRIQRYLPKGLSYFWVCFDDLKNGFGHVIESEQEFSGFFGLDVLAGLLGKEFNPMKLNQSEDFKVQFERCRDFKLMYSDFKPK